MSFNSFNQMTPDHKVWDHAGNMIPDPFLSEGFNSAHPHKPAAWLPVRYFDKYFENWMVTMPGKIVACDNNGDLVPAGYGVTTPKDVIYTANDVTAGVTDVRTGVALLTGGIGTVTVAAVTSFLGQSGVALAISKPIGVAQYAYHQWAGGDGFNPTAFRKHNYNMQHAVGVVHDYMLQLPHVPVVATSEALSFGTVSNFVSTATAVSHIPMAANTVRTPFTFGGASASGLFINQQETLALVTSPGDWYVNLVTGVISVYATVAPSAITLTYYHYDSVNLSVSEFACVVGDVVPGSFLLADANSNFTLATSENFQTVMGQVVAIETHPKDFLDRVRTAYNPAIGSSATGALPGYLGQLDQMAGTATGGVPTLIHYAGGADRVVKINLVSR